VRGIGYACVAKSLPGVWHENSIQVTRFSTYHLFQQNFDILSRRILRGVLNNCIILVCTSQDTNADIGDFPPFRGRVAIFKGLILECSFSQKRSFPRKRRLTRELFRIWHPERTRDTGTKGCGG
jgi:hypothetical protein